MTHDELLAKIDVCFAEVPVDYGQTDAHKALRAVVELHKPDGSFCGECSHDTEVIETYPCPTIQAIEKELV